MRPVVICALLALGITSLLVATATAPIPTGLTVVLDFRGAHSDRSIKEMERETGSILKTTGLKLAWRSRDEAPGSAYPNLVVMTFNGSCKYDREQHAYNELGPLASTATTDHNIQTFGQVDCDHVVHTASSAMWGGDFAHADMLVGRALGRVVTHEIVHMLTNSRQHAHEGVFEAALSGRQLIAPSLPLSAMDVNLLMSGFENDPHPGE